MNPERSDDRIGRGVVGCSQKPDVPYVSNSQPLQFVGNKKKLS